MSKKKKALRNKTKNRRPDLSAYQQGGTTLKEMFFTYNFGKDNKDWE